MHGFIFFASYHNQGPSRGVDVGLIIFKEFNTWMNHFPLDMTLCMERRVISTIQLYLWLKLKHKIFMPTLHVIHCKGNRKVN